MPPESTEIINGRYHVRATLGEGGMGRVDLVEDRLLGNRQLALKRLHAEKVGAQTLQHFRREFRTLATLRHPNLSEVFEFARDRDTGEYFYTSEYVEGEELFQATRGLDEAQIALYVANLCLPLSYIHRRNFLHNDIKPGNVKLLKGTQEVKLLDFGLASVAYEGLGGKNSILSGTPAYMAPEVILGEAASVASDLYAMGMLLYRLIVRKAPFLEESLSQILRRHLEQRIPPARQIKPEISKKMDAIITRCLEHTPMKRYASVLELRDELCSVAKIDAALPPSYSTLVGSAGFIAREQVLSQIIGFIGLSQASTLDSESDFEAIFDDSLKKKFPDSISLLISGNPGSGKSRLLRELQVILQSRDIPAFLQTASQTHSGFAIWQQWLRQLTSEFSVAKDLANIFHKENQQEEESLSYRLMDQLAKGLRELARRQPFVLLLDDLQHLDHASMQMLHFLLRFSKQQEHSPQFKILASIPNTAVIQGELQENLSLFEIDSQTPLVRLENLSREETLQYSLKNFGVQELPNSLIDRFYQITEGNPLFLEEVFHQIVERSDFSILSLREINPASLEIPPTLEEILLDRFRSLSEEEREVLSIAALMQRFFTAEMMASLLQADLQSTKRILFQLSLAGFLLAESEGNWQVRSPAIYEMIRRDLESDNLLLTHQKIAEAFEQHEAGARPDWLANQYLQAQDYAKGAPLQIRAARENRRLGATALARLQLQRLIEAKEKLTESVLFQAQRELGEVEYILGNYALVETLYKPLIENLKKPVHLEDYARVNRVMGKMEQTRGKISDARQYYQQALSALSEGEKAGRYRLLRADLLSLLAFTFSQEGKVEDSLRYLNEALALLPRGTKSSDEREVGTVLILAGAIHAKNGSNVGAVRYWGEARQHFHHCKDLQGESMVENNLGLLHAERQEIKEAYLHYGKSLEISQQTGDLKRFGLTYMQMGNLALLEGNPQRAEIHYREALRTARMLGDHSLESVCLTNLAFADHELGHYARSLENQKNAIDLKQKSRNARDLAHSYYGFANTYFQLGNLAEAENYLSKGLDLIKEYPKGQVHLYLMLLKASCNLKSGDFAAAEKTLNELQSPSQSNLKDRAELQLLLAELHGKKGAYEQAKQHLEQSQTLYPKWLILKSEFALAQGNRRELEGLRERLHGLTDNKDKEISVDLRIRCEFLLGKIDLLFGERRKAFAHFKQAFAAEKTILEEMPEEFHALYQGRKFFQELKNSYHRLELDVPPAADEYKELQNRVESFKRLLSIYPQMRRKGVTRKEIFYHLLDEFLMLTKAERGFVILSDERRHLSIEAARKTNKEVIRNPKEKISQTIVENVFKTGRTVLTFDAAGDLQLSLSKSVVDLKLRSVLCVPLRGAGSPVGVIYLDHPSTRGVFQEETIELTKLFAEHVSLIMEQSQEIRSLRKNLEDSSGELSSLREAIFGKGMLTHFRYDYSPILTQSREMKEVLQILERVIPSDSTVLIEGESGTGKELFAHAIHENGKRKGKPLITVNCGALSPMLLESQLFGHRAGSFTGAISDQQGYFEAAEGGTIFLDEVSEMPLELQVKLLRVLQQGEVLPVGATTAKRVDVRVIAASNRDLAKAVKSGTFREDLYYRINVIALRLPPLRDRQGDIELLVEHFLKEQHAKHPALRKRMTLQAKRALLHYPWPGNVRELKHAVESMFVLATGKNITLQDLPPNIRQALHEREHLFADLTLEKAREEFTRKYLLNLYLQCQGNVAEVARRSGMHRGSLYRLMARYLPGVEAKGKHTREH